MIIIGIRLVRKPVAVGIGSIIWISWEVVFSIDNPIVVCIRVTRICTKSWLKAIRKLIVIPIGREAKGI